MTPQIISLIITLLAVLLMVLPVIWGAIRGLKKSTFRFIWVLCFGVLCFFISGLIAKSLVGIDISFAHLTVDGQQANTLPQYIQLTIEASNQDVANLIADNANLVSLCVSLATLILRLFVFEILFWLTKWIFWPIWAIISHILFGKKKNKKVDAEKEREAHIMQKPNSTALIYNPTHTKTAKTKEVAQKKRAGLGALVGLAMGIFVVLCTFVPVVGINNVLAQINTEIQVDAGDGTTEGILDNQLGENSVYLNVYSDSIIAKAFKYSGIEYVQTGMSNYLTTTTFEGNKISLNAEVSALVPVYNDYIKIKSYDYGNLTEEDITELLPVIDDIQGRIFDSDLVKSLYNQLVPYLVKNILTKSDYFIQIPSLGDDVKDEIVQNILRNLAGITASDEIDYDLLVSLKDIKNDVSKAIGIASELNNAKLLLPIINNDLTLEYVQDKISTELGDKLLDNIFALTTLSRLMPDVIEPALEQSINSIPSTKDKNDVDVSVEYVAVDGGLTYNNFKDYLRRVVRNGILVVKNIDVNSMLYVAGDNFANIGVLIDGLQTDEILSDTTFDSLINYLTVILDKHIDDMSIDSELKDIGSGMVQSLKNIESYEDELGHFGRAYQTYLDSEDGLTIKLVFDMLDEVESTTLYSENIDLIISNGTDYLTRYITENNLPLATDNLETILNKIKGISSFAEEYEKIQSLIKFAEDNIISETIDDLMTEEVLIELGQKIDLTIENGSVLLDDESCKILIKDILKKATLPTDIADKKETIITNVSQIVSYEDEMRAVSRAIKIKDIQDDTELTDRQKLVRLGKVIDDIKTSKLFGNVVVDVVKDYVNDEVDKQTTLNVNITSIVKDAIDDITINLIFENEFGYLYDLVNSADFTDISAFNTHLKNNLINADGSSKSGIITRDVLYDLVIVMADDITFDDLDITSDIKTCFTADKNGTINITDVLDQIDTLKIEVEQIKEVPNEEDMDRTYLVNLGKQIDDMINYTLVLNANAVKTIGNYITEKLYDKLSAITKAQVQSTYDDRTNYTSFETLYTQFADDLGL